MDALRYIVGVDPGTEAVGVAVLEDNLNTGEGLRPVEHDFIRADGPRHIRLFWVHERLLKMFARLRERLDGRRLDIAVERMFVHSNPATAIILGEARGVVLAAAGAIPKARLFDYSPMEHKKAVTGDGRAEKFACAAAVALLLGLKEEVPLDVADAYCIAYHHARQGKPLKPAGAPPGPASRPP